MDPVVACSVAQTRRLKAAILLSGLLFRLGLSVTSDALEMVPAGGGELTLFQAVGGWA